jgi:ADP-ribose pyrophosphatase
VSKAIDLMSRGAKRRITARRLTVVSPWVTLVERTVLDARGGAQGIFHSLAVADYVSIIAISEDGLVPLVRQFRPAVERWTLEFPGGLLDEGEKPDQCALRELREEVGLQAPQATSLGVFLPDSGRLSNRLWGFFVSGASRIKDWSAECDVEVVWSTVGELEESVRDGSFDHAPHLALFAIAHLRGLL